MPLSPAAPRRHLHTRAIELRGYLREDGLVDIEAHLTDTKAVPSRREDGGTREIGEPVHDMWLRMTITTQRQIVACEAAMDTTPFAVCPGVAPNYAALVGLTIEAGFIRRAMERLAGPHGCTHLRELLQQVGTVAFQTLYSTGTLTDDPARIGNKPPPLLNSCYAWGESRDVVRRKFPAYYVPEPAADAAE